MKITDITTESYSWPRKRPIRNGKYTYTNAGLSVTRIFTDEGVTGVGLGGVNRDLLERFKPLLLGEDPFNLLLGLAEFTAAFVTRTMPPEPRGQQVGRADV